MDVKWDYELKGDQRACPVMHAREIDMPNAAVYPSERQLKKIFLNDSFKLQTWGRTEGVVLDDPHWLAVRGSTPLHTDPRYPRYSYQLKVRCDPGIVCRGLDKVEQPLFTGLYYVLDTHSPHQVLSQNPKAWNVTASIDLDEYTDNHEIMITRLMHQATTVPFLDGVKR